MTSVTGDEDLDVISPIGERMEIEGMAVEVGRLKTREFLSILRILTNGIGPGLKDVKLNLDDEADLSADLMALFVVALPDAVDEFIEFCRTVVKPVRKQDTGAVLKALDNPDPDVMLEMIERIINQEIDDLKVLAGKAQAMWSRVQGVYQKRAAAG